ncbi:MAG TPA: response regulator transcription factor [Candidatus Choladocola avistercoris]|nr:response regulator transcription factor [Candidatus Choladocola avistercoris]
MQKILIVEDDRLIAELERDYLESSGFDICRELRKDKNLPIIMVTAKKTDVDKIRGLGLGADDYIIKPFSPAELVARVRAHIKIHERLLREANPQERKESCIEIRNLKIYPLSRKVFVGEEEVAMTNKEFELLLFFARNPNIVFSRDTLFDRIWGMDSIGDTDTVTVHVNRIRAKIEENSSEPKYIETIWGVGYRFNV